MSLSKITITDQDLGRLPFFVIRAIIKRVHIKNVRANAKAPVYAVSARGDNAISVGDQLVAYICTPMSFPTYPMGTVAEITER